MPRIVANRAILTAETVSAVNLIRARKRQLEGLNGDRTTEQAHLTDGHIVGLVEAEAFILEAACDRAQDPNAPL